MKRYTLSLPDMVHEELEKAAKDNEVSVRDIVLKCVKIGLIALKTENDENKELILRETEESGEKHDTKLLLIG